MKKMNMAVAAAALLLMASCGTTKKMEGAGKVNANDKKTETKAEQSAALRNLAFVQKVSDNQVYTNNIVGNMNFNLQAADKDITVPGKLSMRKDEVIRIQLMIPILGTEVGRLEFTPNYVLIIDRLHKEYIKADYTQVDFLKKQGVNFYSLQALFWNQLLVPGTKKVTDADLKKFSANLDAVGENVPVALQYGKLNYTWTANRNSGRITEANVVYQGRSTSAAKLNLKYSNFKNVGVKMFPATQNLTLSAMVNNKPQVVKINIDMKSVKTDSKWEAQTEVSDKYKKVAPEDVLGKLMSM